MKQNWTKCSRDCSLSLSPCVHTCMYMCIYISISIWIYRYTHDWVTDLIWSDTYITYMQIYICIMITINTKIKHIYQFSSVTQSCPTLWNPMNRSTPGLPVHHQLPEFTQTHVHRVGDAIHPSHPLSSPSPPAPNPSQHQGLFQWVNPSHEVAKVLAFQL